MKQPYKILPFHTADFSENYAELNNFRNDLQEKGLAYQMYQAGKVKAVRYRAIFFLFSLIFVALACWIYTKTPVWLLSFEHSKPLVCLFSFTAGFASLGLCLLLNPEKEAIQAIHHAAHLVLKKHYQHRKSLATKNQELEWLELFRHRIGLREQYISFKDKLRHCERETIRLMDQIRRSTSQEKGQLYYQALAELQEKLNKLLQDY